MHRDFIRFGICLAVRFKNSSTVRRINTPTSLRLPQFCEVNILSSRSKGTSILSVYIQMVLL